MNLRCEMQEGNWQERWDRAVAEVRRIIEE